jgi:hypothetical protein
MAINSLYPSFIQLHYVSAYGKHVQTLPTRQWSSAGFTHGYGGYTSWGGASIEADTMVNAMIATIAPWVDPAINWVDAIVFNYAAPLPAVPNPVTIIPLTAVGTGAANPANQALQSTYMFFDDAFHTFKFIMLDASSVFDFQPLNYASLPSVKKTFVDYMLGNTHAFMSRGDGKPHIFRQLVEKFNNKLRREYRLS